MSKFAAAVAKAPTEIQHAIRPGKQALKGNHRSKLTCKAERRIAHSLDVDAAFAKSLEHATANRWDYGVHYRSTAGREHALWIEVHPAATGEVRTVIAKLSWLKAYLREHASELLALSTEISKTIPPFVWLATDSGVHITANSPQARLLAAHGMGMPRQALVLP